MHDVETDEAGFEQNIKLCQCGSGEERYVLYDARNIPISNVCFSCEDIVKARYRPEIFTDSNYDTYGEQVEEDY